jgi:hypothetical protein
MNYVMVTVSPRFATIKLAHYARQARPISVHI